jgi:choice-of-anchor C domain-containing protein
MKLKLIQRFGVGALGALLLLPIAASANLVLDGGFEDPAITGTYTTYGVGAMGAWTVAAGSVDLIHDYWQPAAGSQSVDVAGNINGTIVQTISGLTVGQTYELSFEMAGNPDGAPTIKTLKAGLGSDFDTFTFDTTGHTEASMGWTLMTAMFTATSASEVLSFQDLSGVPSPYGSALDSVSLTAVPEPTTVVAGLLLLLPFGMSTVKILRNRTAKL